VSFVQSENKETYTVSFILIFELSILKQNKKTATLFPTALNVKRYNLLLFSRALAREARQRSTMGKKNW